MSQSAIAATIFALTYAGIAMGGLPGLAVDRTGVAVIGAISMIAAGAISPSEAVSSMDFPTILLLYALMVVSAQLRLGGFYTRVAGAVSARVGSPRRFLLVLMLVSAGLSAVLANDIVCLAFTPVLCVSLMRAGFNPLPFLVGMVSASNIGSAATIIGNPQNMLIGQGAGLDFGRFILWCGPPSAIALMAAHFVIARIYRDEFRLSAPVEGVGGDWPRYDAHQSNKGIALTVILMALFFTPISRELSALAVAGVFLLSRRMRTREILGLVDWHLITLFAGLFIVIGGVEKYALPAEALRWLGSHGMDLGGTFTLSAVTVALSNLVSNVPAVMLLMKQLHGANTSAFYLLALMSTFAGNLILIGSIANLITAEQARPYGVELTFRAHLRAGVPVTLVTCAIALGWAYLMG